MHIIDSFTALEQPRSVFRVPRDNPRRRVRPRWTSTATCRHREPSVEVPHRSRHLHAFLVLVTRSRDW